jgi:hypothetical protein
MEGVIGPADGSYGRGIDGATGMGRGYTGMTGCIGPADGGNGRGV